jgi:hypothetical protein
LVFANGTKETVRETGKEINLPSPRWEIPEQSSKALRTLTAETGIPIENLETTGDDYRAH